MPAQLAVFSLGHPAYRKTLLQIPIDRREHPELYLCDMNACAPTFPLQASRDGKRELDASIFTALGNRMGNRNSSNLIHCSEILRAP